MPSKVTTEGARFGPDLQSHSKAGQDKGANTSSSPSGSDQFEEEGAPEGLSGGGERIDRERGQQLLNLVVVLLLCHEPTSVPALQQQSGGRDLELVASPLHAVPEVLRAIGALSESPQGNERMGCRKGRAEADICVPGWCARSSGSTARHSVRASDKPPVRTSHATGEHKTGVPGSLRSPRGSVRCRGSC